MKKINALSDLLMAIVFNFGIAFLFGSVTGTDTRIWFAVIMLASLRFAKKPSVKSINFLKDGLNKEVWLADLIESFWPDWSFLNEAEDMSEWVENDAINLAEAGVEPSVLINNNVFPVPFAQRADTPLRLVLNTYDTEGTVIRKSEEVELAYNKRQSVVSGHKNALANKIGLHAAHSYAPAANGAFTPVLNKTASSTFDIEFLIEMEEKFNDLDVPMGKRVAVLTSQHLAAIRKQNLNLFKEVASNPGVEVYGFKLYTFSKLPAYNATTLAKNAFGAAFNPATDRRASIFFHGGSVMKAVGTADMFARLNDPEQKGDIINFQQRALVLPKNNKYLGAIIQ